MKKQIFKDKKKLFRIKKSFYRIKRWRIKRQRTNNYKKQQKYLFNHLLCLCDIDRFEEKKMEQKSPIKKHFVQLVD